MLWIRTKTSNFMSWLASSIFKFSRICLEEEKVTNYPIDYVHLFSVVRHDADNLDRDLGLDATLHEPIISDIAGSTKRFHGVHNVTVGQVMLTVALVLDAIILDVHQSLFPDQPIGRLDQIANGPVHKVHRILVRHQLLMHKPKNSQP